MNVNVNVRQGRARAAFVALALHAALTSFGGEITDRFVYTGCDLCNSQKMAGLRELARKAAASGYTGLVVQGDIQYAFRFGERQRDELRELKRVCDEVGLSRRFPLHPRSRASAKANPSAGAT